MGVETLDLGHDLKLPRPSKIWVGTSWCKLAGRISQYLGLPVNQPPSAFGRFELEVSREGARASSLVLPGDWKLASGFGNLVTTYPWFDEVKSPFVSSKWTADTPWDHRYVGFATHGSDAQQLRLQPWEAYGVR